MNRMACALSGLNEERVALVDVSVSAVLRDQLSEVTLSQTYRNDEAINIEAIYTFTIPLDAVLLELQVEIGGRVLNGLVVEKRSAEEQYEDAIASGDSAVMLEMLEPGMYTMNVGNLLPGEKATITFCYANIYRWNGDQLRLFLPTTVAPRYGHSRHLPQQEPEFSLTVENKFSVEVEATGNLRNAQFVCPSHAVTLTRSNDKVIITLTETKAVMDRDFILNIKTTNTERRFALCDVDGDSLAAVASFQPFFPGLQQPRPLNLAIVVDCSGSMGGDSMHQAKQALVGIIDALQANDKVTMIAFGSTTNMLSESLLACNKSNLGKIRRFAQQLEADMGGTEIGRALASAHNVLSRFDASDIFLVTDGEVSSWESVVDDAIHAGNRIFTVGVGSAVTEAFVRKLAKGTGGECELVSPREGMADKVIRHFERMRAVRAKKVTVQWPEYAIDTTPSKIGSVFEGDTVITSARFDRKPESDIVTLEVETDSGEVFLQDLQIKIVSESMPENRVSKVARLAASERLKQENGDKGAKTALHYRLVSPWTNWLVVAPRAEGEQAMGMPELRKVPQSLQAGWGGSGSVLFCQDIDRSALRMQVFSRVPDIDSKTNPSLVKEQRVLRESVPTRPTKLETLIGLINDDPGRMNPDSVLDLLLEAGFEDELSDLFQHAEHLEFSVQLVAAIVLSECLKGSLHNKLSPDAKRWYQDLKNHTDEVFRLFDELHVRVRDLDAIVRRANATGIDILDPRFTEYLMETMKRFDGLPDIHDHIRRSVNRLTGRKVSTGQKKLWSFLEKF